MHWVARPYRAERRRNIAAARLEHDPCGALSGHRRSTGAALGEVAFDLDNLGGPSLAVHVRGQQRLYSATLRHQRDPAPVADSSRGFCNDTRR